MELYEVCIAQGPYQAPSRTFPISFVQNDQNSTMARRVYIWNKCYFLPPFTEPGYNIAVHFFTQSEIKELLHFFLYKTWDALAPSYGGVRQYFLVF